MTNNEQRPDFIKHYSEIQEADDAHYPGSTELLSIGSPFGKQFGFTKLGIHHEVLLPGRRTSWPHAESTEEEFAYVIEGHPDVWVDGHLYPLKPGDGVGFAAGTGITHTFINNTSEPVRLLVVGERTRADNKCFYALHPKRNEEIAAKNFLWVDIPKRELGPHDGLPNALRQTVGLRVRSVAVEDIEPMMQYWENATQDDLDRMGELRRPDAEANRKFMQDFCSGVFTPLEAGEDILIWEHRGRAIGYSTLKNFRPGNEGQIHLHMWAKEFRGQGLGAILFCLSALHFIKAYQLKRLYCEPKASNPMPNQMLRRIGFSALDNYVKTSPDASVEYTRYHVDAKIAESHLRTKGLTGF